MPLARQRIPRKGKPTRKQVGPVPLVIADLERTPPAATDSLPYRGKFPYPSHLF